MRILRVISSMDPSSGGPCQGIRNSIPELQKLGVENEVVCLDSPELVYETADSFLIHKVGPRSTPLQYSKWLTPWLLENLGRFDIVISHGIWLYTSYASSKAVEKFNRITTGKKIQFYVMPHGMLDPYFQKADSRKIKALRNRIYWKLIESKVINNADAVLFTCQSELELARIPFSPYHPKKELNVGYGIKQPPPFVPEMQRAFSSACNQPLNKGYILFLSRLHEKKGVDILIKAYSKFVNERGDFPALVIAGPGIETDYGHYLQQLVNSHEGLKKNIYFAGMLQGDAKWGAFYGCEAFILPSHQENFGIAVVEALACGKPVLITNQVNIWKEIGEAAAGLVERDDLSGVENLLLKFATLSHALKMQMSQNAYQCYAKHFSIEQAAKTLMDKISAS